MTGRYSTPIQPGGNPSYCPCGPTSIPCLPGEIHPTAFLGRHTSPCHPGKIHTTVFVGRHASLLRRNGQPFCGDGQILNFSHHCNPKDASIWSWHRLGQGTVAIGVNGKQFSGVLSQISLNDSIPQSRLFVFRRKMIEKNQRFPVSSILSASIQQSSPH